MDKTQKIIEMLSQQHQNVLWCGVELIEMALYNTMNLPCNNNSIIIEFTDAVCLCSHINYSLNDATYRIVLPEGIEYINIDIFSVSHEDDPTISSLW